MVVHGVNGEYPADLRQRTCLALQTTCKSHGLYANMEVVLNAEAGSEAA